MFLTWLLRHHLEEEVDLDSFVGQASVARAEGHRLSSGMWQSEPIPLFESVTPESTFADPFAGISGNSAPRTVSLCALGSDLPPQPMLPSVTAGVVTEGQLPASQDGAMLNPLPLAPGMSPFRFCHTFSIAALRHTYVHIHTYTYVVSVRTHTVVVDQSSNRPHNRVRCPDCEIPGRSGFAFLSSDNSMALRGLIAIM